MPLSFTRKSVLASSMALALGVGFSALALQVPGDPAPPPTPPGEPPQEPRDPQQPEEPREPERMTHTGVVVDLHSYLQMSDRHDRERRPTVPGDPTAPGEEDRTIDWTEGNYKANIEAGVPLVLMIQDRRPWGPAQAQPHVVVFDPEQSVSREAFEQLKEKGGEEVEVVGNIRRENAMRGLRVIVVEDLR